jgi:GNAT superfamily N-acetyltransferase
VAVERGDVVGVGVAGLHAHSSNTEAAFTWAAVRRDRRRRGIGTRLAELAQVHAREHGARRLTCWSIEAPENVAFAAMLGFAPARAAVHSVLDPRTVDMSGLESLPSSVRVVSLAELGDRLEDVFVAVQDAVLDEPSTVPADRLRLDEWLEELENPIFSREATFCTLEEDEVAAFAEIHLDGETAVAGNGFTGTRRAFRGRGYATAAKLGSIRYLAGRGVTALWTGNDEGNAAMLAVNRRLGYEPAVRAVELVFEGD